MKRIKLQNIDLLLRGASVLACGGGLSYQQQGEQVKKSLLQQALKQGIVLLEPQELQESDICITVSEVGAASAPPMERSTLPKALQILEEHIGKKVVALVPGEIGQETILLEAAAVLNLPIVDVDLAGCRAVPRLSDMALIRQGVPFTLSPLVVAKQSGEVTLIKSTGSLEKDESSVRPLVPAGQVVTLLGGAISGKMLQDRFPYRSYRLAMRVGRSLSNLSDVSAAVGTKQLLSLQPVVVKEVQEESADGFDVKTAILQISDTVEGKLTIENEYMKLQVEEMIFTFPQLIFLIDQKEKRGLHSSEITVGKTAILMVQDSFSFWKGVGA